MIMPLDEFSFCDQRVKFLKTDFNMARIDEKTEGKSEKAKRQYREG